MKFFAATAANINDLAAEEARQVGADPESISVVPGGVEFEGSLETAYRFALWSRTASRLLLLIGTGEGIESGDQLYHRAMAVPWFEHLTPDKSFAVYATVRGSRWLRDSRFGALKVKDAIADQMREIHDTRPYVDTETPDLRVQVHIDGLNGYFYIDLTGESLHRRGYRRSDSAVSMKEHTASALLLRAGWPAAAAEGKPLIDPFCGSGTIPIEAALMASDCAPGLLHPDTYAFLIWKGHDAPLWERLLTEARERKLAGSGSVPPIYGWDIDRRSVQAAESHAFNAGVEDHISFAVHDITRLGRESVPVPAGIIVSDPPYGIRSGGGLRSDDGPRTSEGPRLKDGGAHSERSRNEGGLGSQVSFRTPDLETLYRKTGETLAAILPGWRISLICGEPDLLRNLRMKPDSINSLFNGGLKCTVAHYSIFSPEERERMRTKAEERHIERETAELSLGAEMFANRLRKNRRMLKAFFKRSGATSYRLYDADMPEYSAAIDIYEDRWVHLQEYAPPLTVDPAAAEIRLQEMVDGVNRVTGIPYEQIFVKQRKRQKGSKQYTRKEKSSPLYIMREHGLMFYVNFVDYIDTGIFLDHRPVRQMIKDMSEGKRFLNLFGYTGTATVHAAAGGALSTMTVDASRTYLGWAEKNMELNGFTGMAHQFHQADCTQWLEEHRHRFDLIFLDPPTFSNSKSRPEVLDIQRDHEKLIMSTMRRLEQDGTLIFSNNYRNFELSPVITDRYVVEEITDRTVPEDFTRNKRIHRCWIIRLRQRAVPEAHKPEARKPEVRKTDSWKTDAGKAGDRKPEVRNPDSWKTDAGKPDAAGRQKSDAKAAVVKKKVVRQPQPPAPPRKKSVRAVTPAKDGAEKSPQKKKKNDVPDDDSLTLDF